ncbi:FAD-dependent oxidoreductase [Ahniella affigens]|uniref:FAD-dependent oxidoreductase n=1 Tax=Ahniella affigens TaxID=2021234 RepID=A0A2P1PR83_9GAMM|nr:FAD-dependent oxidoreductase [Ahniella affigens]AVP97353.1 FAD-dependent oxidoreductase [Ahniella affigens]
MHHDAPILIIGSGLAGVTVAREFRKLDKTQPLTLISADIGGFYSKPMLSNAFASGRSPESLLTTTADVLAEQLQIETRSGCNVLAIDRAQACVHLQGETLRYRQLVLALGADPIRLTIAGDAQDAVLSVNDWADYVRFRERAQSARRILVLGAGLIGCEFANDLRYADQSVTVLDVADQPLSRLLPPHAAERLRSALMAAGIAWRLGQTVSALEHHSGRLQATFNQGDVETFDLVLSAVGLRPRVALAQAAGLAVGRGIQVNRQLASSDPNIFALGDCAAVDGWVLPYVMPIMQAARALAKTLAGTPTDVSYPAMPVVVKTPAMPVVVCPPPEGVAGTWEEQVDAEGVLARFVDPDGHLRGFALVGAATAEKNALAKALPAWL